MKLRHLFLLAVLVAGGSALTVKAAGDKPWPVPQCPSCPPPQCPGSGCPLNIHWNGLASAIDQWVWQ